MKMKPVLFVDLGMSIQKLMMTTPNTMKAMSMTLIVIRLVLDENLIKP
jgi:hypothetical protein